MFAVVAVVAVAVVMVAFAVLVAFVVAVVGVVLAVDAGSLPCLATVCRQKRWRLSIRSSSPERCQAQVISW